MAATGILAEIVERTLAEVTARRRRVSVRDLEARAAEARRRRRGFEAALRQGGREAPPRFICEIKKASPSKGVLKADLDPARQAGLYDDAGAAAVSVVTEPHFFAGDPAFLDRAREGAPALPLLRKDFHVHELQVFETAAGPADALLLLATVLSPTQLGDYLDIADAFGLDHLVEVNDPREAERALKAGARVIGVNNRNLATFEVDVARTEAVLPALASTGTLAVAESGIRDPATVARLTAAGVEAFLVGEALLTAEDPVAKLAALRGE